MGLLTALFALAALMWLIPVVRAGRLFVFALVILMAGTVFGPAFFSIDGPIQISLDRVLFLMMIALAAIGWRLGEVSLPRLTRVDFVIAAIVVWFYISAIRWPTPTGTPPVARWLFNIAMPSCMYLIVRMIRITRQDVRWMLFGATGLGVYLAITAVLEIGGLHSLVFPRFIVDAEMWEFFGRGRGPLLNPAGNGIIMSVGLVAATLALMNADYHKKAFYGLVILCLLAGIYATLTRSAWLGGVAAVGIIVWAYSPRYLRVLGLAASLVLVGFAAMGLKDEIVRMKRDKNLTAADAEKSVKLRPLLAVVAWEMFKDRPIAGSGYGHYFAKSIPYHSNRSYGMPLEQARTYYHHNVFLSILVDTGLVGFSLFAAWLTMLTSVAWRMARNRLADREVRCVGWIFLGFLIAYACNGMFHDAGIIPMVHMYLFFISAVAVTAWQTGLEEQPSPAANQIAGLNIQSPDRRRNVIEESVGIDGIARG